jgi:hypothetical protein
MAVKLNANLHRIRGIALLILSGAAFRIQDMAQSCAGHPNEVPRSWPNEAGIL